VAVGASVGVALGSGEGKTNVPVVPGTPIEPEPPDVLVADGLLGTNEAKGPTLASSNMLGKTAAVEEYASAATRDWQFPRGSARLSAYVSLKLYRRLRRTFEGC
jgi:hypothetical protein